MDLRGGATGAVAGAAGWAAERRPVSRAPFCPLRIATVAPVMNPTRKAITTLKITVSFFMLIFSLPKILPYRGDYANGGVGAAKITKYQPK